MILCDFQTCLSGEAHTCFHLSDLYIPWRQLQYLTDSFVNFARWWSRLNFPFQCKFQWLGIQKHMTEKTIVYICTQSFTKFSLKGICWRELCSLKQKKNKKQWLEMLAFVGRFTNQYLSNLIWPVLHMIPVQMTLTSFQGLWALWLCINY